MKVRFLRLYFLLALAGPAFGADSSFVFDGSFAESANYKGGQLGVTFIYPASSAWDFSAGFMRAERTYAGTTKIVDDMGTASATWRRAPDNYILAAISFAPSAEILARQIVTVDPHWISSGFDYGLGFRYSEYKLVNAGMLNPSVYTELSERWAFGGGVFLVVTSHVIQSAVGSATYRFSDVNLLKTSVAGGRALEDAGVEADFHSVTIDHEHRFAKNKIVLGATRYESVLRMENSVFLRWFLQ